MIERDGNYVKFDTGVVYDKKTSLEWYAGPNRDTNWNEAKRWVENLTVSGGGWRMPTRQELKHLFKKGAGERNMTPLLKTTGKYVYVWSGETKGSLSAWIFGFFVDDNGYERWPGGYESWHGRDHSKFVRGFAVRSRR